MELKEEYLNMVIDAVVNRVVDEVFKRIDDVINDVVKEVKDRIDVDAVAEKAMDYSSDAVILAIENKIFK